jgi:hypothetical protein
MTEYVPGGKRIFSDLDGELDCKSRTLMVKWAPVLRCFVGFPA